MFQKGQCGGKCCQIIVGHDSNDFTKTAVDASIRYAAYSLPESRKAQFDVLRS